MLLGIFPPSGERWLRVSDGYGRAVDDSYVAIRCQAVDVARNISTVWRAVATGERWLREGGGYGRAVATGERSGCVF
jgi:hypothetical protein